MSGVSVSLLGYIYIILNSGTIDNIEEFYVVLRGGADKFYPGQEGNKLPRPNSGFIQHTPHEAQYTSYPVALTFASH